MGVVTLDADGLLVHPLLAAPPTLTLWRAPTDNDRIGGMAARWAAAGVDRLARRLIGIDRDGPTTVVRAEVSTSADIVVTHEVRYTALAGDGIAVTERVEIPAALDDLARVGTVLEVVPGLEDVEWFGTGPHETYPDRRRSGLVGRWTSTVTDQYVPYVRPQENGGHADVRWLRLSDATGAGLRIDLDRPARCRRPTSAPPTSPRRPTTSTWSRARRRSSTSTPPTGAWARRAAARTRCPSTSWAPGRTAGAGPRGTEPA